ncbi:MAG: dockerin type I repeat-containing protein, partial [Lachnospiraceae bacterium]|nr:dockerin type I repeat-containing protein [Lachnospiraceae bacterium]
MRLKSIKQAIATITGSLVLISFFSVSSIFASANSSDYEYELDLTCSSTKYFDDEDTTTYFYVETDYEGESITLVNADDLTEYTMLDDGKFSISGDDMPYDAVYSLRLELNTDGVTYENPKVLSFYAITEDGVISDTITIKIIKRITTLQISEMASVDEMINTLVESENYTSASFEEKTSMVYDLLVNLAEHGTEEYPYSLIFSNSISFTGTIYSFKYSCGSLGGVPIADPFQTTEPTGVGDTTTETTVTTTPIVTTDVIGDVNDDGNFNVADVLLIQKWLVGIPNTEIANWQAADLCKDGKLNVFDLCMLKRRLLGQNLKMAEGNKNMNDSINITSVNSISNDFKSKLSEAITNTNPDFDFSDFTFESRVWSNIADENHKFIGERHVLWVYYKNILLNPDKYAI